MTSCLIASLAHGAEPASANINATTCSGARAVIPQNLARSGDWVVVENNVGDRNPRYGTTTDFGKVPFCAVRIHEGTSSAPRWVFCTHNTLRACGQDAQGPVPDGPQLPRLDEARLAWVLARARYETRLSRAITQTHVWCVTDRARRGRTDDEIITAARKQFSADQRIELPPDLRCPDWSRIDPTLRTDPILRVSADQQQVTVGEQASFSVTTNLPSLRATALDSAGRPLPLAVCAGGDHANLRGGVLTVSGTSNTLSRAVQLCTTLDTATSATVTVTAEGVLADRITSIRSTRAPSSCQLFAGTSGLELTRRAEVVAVTPPPAETPNAPQPPAEAPHEPPPPPPAAPTQGPPELLVTKQRRRARGEHRRVRSGARVSWAITVTNHGTSSATRVRICDVLPRGLVLVRAPEATIESGGRVCWRVSQLSPGARVVRTLTTIALLDPAARRCRRITNRVRVTAPELSPVGGRAPLTICRPSRPTRPGGATG